MDRRDWALLTIAAAGGDRLQPVELQKSLFLLGEGLPEQVGDNFYDFKPYNYGPFDHQVYADAESLAAEGYVRVLPAERGRWREFAASESGLTRAKELVDSGVVDSGAFDFLTRVVEWARGKSFNELVRSIYRQFPRFRENSVFQDS